MVQLNDVFIDAFGRVKEAVHETVEGLSEADLVFRPNESANSIAWLVWHLTRVQDDHLADALHGAQVWTHDGWVGKFNLSLDEADTGYGHTMSQVAAVQANANLLLGYHDAVYAKTIEYIEMLTSKDYEKVVDKHWDPPVTMAVRLVSVASDDLQHAGQAAYIRGLLKS